MNFYKRYIGDYARDTAHLSLTEHGVYAVLLDTGYATEKPLPGPLPALYRICRAATAAERRAVDLVAEQFFPVGQDGGRRNPRVEAELASANAYAHAQSKRAQMRWHKPDGMQAQCPDDASHSHSQSKPKSTTLSGSPPDPLQLSHPGPNGKGQGNGAYNAEAEQVLGYLNRATGRAYQFRNPKGGKLTPNGQVIVARLSEGYTAEQLREVVHLKAEVWRTDAKMSQYLRPKTLFGRENFAQYVGELEPA